MSYGKVSITAIDSGEQHLCSVAGDFLGRAAANGAHTRSPPSKLWWYDGSRTSEIAEAALGPAGLAGLEDY
jgi:hypothetical protein